MLAGAIVPKGQRAGRPTEAALHFRIPRRSVKLLQQRLAFRRIHIFNMAGKAGIDIKHTLFGFGMGANDRMLHRREFFVQIFRRPV